MAKPAAGTPINTSHALASGLLHFWPFNEGSGSPSDAVTGETAALTGTAWGTDANGDPMLSHTATTDRTQLLADGSGLPTTAATIVVAYQKRDTTNRNSGLFGFDSSANRLGAHAPYSDGVVYWDFGGTSGANRCTYTSTASDFQSLVPWSYTTGSRGMEIWRGDTAVKMASNASTPTRGSHSLPWYLGDYTTSNSDLVDYSWVAIYDRQLSESEIESLHSDPWQMFATPLLLRRRHAARRRFS